MPGEGTLGGWAIEAAVIEWIRAHIPSGSTILEFGSGAGTEVLSKHYRMFSVEHDPAVLRCGWEEFRSGVKRFSVINP